MPTLLAVGGTQPDPAYPSDGENLWPALTGVAPHPRKFYWRCCRRLRWEGRPNACCWPGLATDRLKSASMIEHSRHVQLRDGGFECRRS